jgi:hypothetical protein
MWLRDDELRLHLKRLGTQAIGDLFKIGQRSPTSANMPRSNPTE